MDLVTVSKITNSFMREDLPQIGVGDTIRVYTKVKEAKGIRSQAFEGVVMSHRHGQIDTSIVVRKLSDAGIFVERIFSIHSPAIDKIEVVKKGRVRRAKINYLRGRVGKQALFVKPAKAKVTK